MRDQWSPESARSYPVSNVVAIDGILEQEQAGGVVDCQRPEDLCG